MKRSVAESEENLGLPDDLSDRRRLLLGWSSHEETPRCLLIEWGADGRDYQLLLDTADGDLERGWSAIWLRDEGFLVPSLSGLQDVLLSTKSPLQGGIRARNDRCPRLQHPRLPADLTEGRSSHS
jgi:hypothetical protein